MYPEYSLVVPVFKAGPHIRELFQAVHSFFEKRGLKYELIVVDDSGREKNWAPLCQLKKEYPSILRAFRLRKNYGQHPATWVGMQAARAPFIITLDEDLQYPPSEIAQLIQTQQTYASDLVYGYFPIYPLQGGRYFFSYLLRLSIGSRVSSAYSSFRLVKKELVNSLERDTYQAYFIDAYLARQNPQVNQVAVKHQERNYGTSSYSWGRLAEHLYRVLAAFPSWLCRFRLYMGGMLLFLSILGLLSLFLAIPPLGYRIAIFSGLLGISASEYYLYRLRKELKDKSVFGIVEML